MIEMQCQGLDAWRKLTVVRKSSKGVQRIVIDPDVAVGDISVDEQPSRPMLNGAACQTKLQDALVWKNLQRYEEALRAKPTSGLLDPLQCSSC